MSSLPMSEAQSAVVWSDHASLIVEAAAGSGKTRVLVARYLKHVQEDGVAADQILTVTFTRKAAAEMKRRIVDALREAGLNEAAQIAETGPIQTLHGFCERLLRENALAAGLDPDFEILDTATSRDWVESAIQLAIAEQDSPHAAAYVEHTAGKRNFGAGSGDHSKIFQEVRDGLMQLRGTLHDAKSIAKLHIDPDRLIARWRQVLSAEIPEPILETAGKLSAELGFWTSIKTAYKDAGKEFKAPVWLESEKKPAVCDQIEWAVAQRCCGLASIVCAAWMSLEERMWTEQKLDFSLLESLAVKCLVENESVRHRVQKQYKVVLVDEGQDLNPVQYRFLNELRSDVEMTVGDAQQSIYRFRQADVRLFKQKGAEKPKLNLPQNYRSTAPILNLVDRFFTAVWPDYVAMKPAGDWNGEPFEGIEIWEADKNSKRQVLQWIEETIESERNASDIAVLPRQHRHAGEIVEALKLRGHQVREVGGGQKFFARLELKDLSNLLFALIQPEDDFALAAVLRSPIVGLSLDAVVLLTAEAPIAANWKSVELPSSEDRAKLDRFIEWFSKECGFADRLPAWEILSRVFAETPLLENLAKDPYADQKIANVRKLLILASQRPEMGARQFALFLRRIQELEHKEGDAPTFDDSAAAVQVMTVHKAKGLEFPVVILPETHIRMARSAGNLEIDKDHGFLALGDSSEPSMIRSWIADRRKDAERDEELRTLYVAMTRAKRKLCIVVDPRPGATTLAQKLSQVLAATPDSMPGVVIRRASPSEP